jgi:hypothetical protein
LGCGGWWPGWRAAHGQLKSSYTHPLLSFSPLQPVHRVSKTPLGGPCALYRGAYALQIAAEAQ